MIVYWSNQYERGRAEDAKSPEKPRLKKSSKKSEKRLAIGTMRGMMRAYKRKDAIERT